MLFMSVENQVITEALEAEDGTSVVFVIRRQK